MTRRNRESWNPALNVLAFLAAVLFGLGVYEAFATEITVSLLWPLGSTAGMLWFGYRTLAHRHAARVRAAADASDEQARLVIQERAQQPTVADVLHSCRPDRLIGDAERDVVVTALHSHFAAGRLDVAELNERTTLALGARTVADLFRAVDELPDEVTGR